MQKLHERVEFARLQAGRAPKARVGRVEAARNRVVADLGSVSEPRRWPRSRLWDPAAAMGGMVSAVAHPGLFLEHLLMAHGLAQLLGHVRGPKRGAGALRFDTKFVDARHDRKHHSCQ